MTPQDELESIKDVIRQALAEIICYDGDISGKCHNCSAPTDFSNEREWTIAHDEDCPYTKLARLVGMSNVQVTDRFEG